MPLDRMVYYSKIRSAPFPGKLTGGVVNGNNIVLDVWESSFSERTPLTQLAVCLATMFHETGHRMWPVKELGGNEYLRLNYDITGRNPERARKYGNVRPGDGVKYCGRGDVQLTWFVNYQKATKRMKELKLIDIDV